MHHTGVPEDTQTWLAALFPDASMNPGSHGAPP